MRAVVGYVGYQRENNEMEELIAVVGYVGCP